MTGEGEVLALDTPTLLALLKIPASTLNYWVDKGFCTPTLDAGSGKRATRYWTVEDLVVLRAIKELRAAGCSLQLVTTVEQRLRESFQSGLSNAVLYYNGQDVFVEEDGVVMSVVRDAGQVVFAETLQITAFRLRPWVEEGRAQATLVDIDGIRARREAARAKRTA